MQNERLSKMLGDYLKLSDEEQSLIASLVQDIADRNLDPRHLASDCPPRVAMAKYEASTLALTPEQCAEELGRSEIDVSVTLTAGHSCPPGGFLVSKLWTESGLRHAVARERFFDSIEFAAVDQYGWGGANNG